MTSSAALGGLHAAPAKPARPRRRLHRPGRRSGYVFIAPFFIVFLAFTVYPWVETAWMSLHDVRLSTYDQRTWVGLGNYRDLITNHYFWNAFFNTFSIGVI